MNPVNWRLDWSNFNIDNGYLEGIVRGFKSKILKQTDYFNLTQCDHLEGTCNGHRKHKAATGKKRKKFSVNFKRKSE